MDGDNNSNLRELRSCPLCIICGRPGEAEEIAKALGIADHTHRLQGHEVSGIQGHTFYLGAFKLDSGEKLKYYVTSSLRMGIQSFTIHAAVLFNILKPRFVVHAGVCAGDEHGRTKMKLRDVVFGEAAINYEEGKFEKLPLLGVVFRPDYNRVSTRAGNMQAFADSANHPNYHYGEYVSGSAVRSDAATIFSKIRSEVNRNAIALDMEASAFIQLCDHFGPNGPTCLGVIKGISDFGNSKKGHDATARDEALKNTAKALEDWITYHITKITWTPDESGEPGAMIVPGYYENFVRRVLDNHVQGIEAYLQKNPETKIPYKEVKGLLCILPEGRSAGSAKELGTTQTVITDYGIQEISIGGQVGKRLLSYKGGYFIDWCRCVNSLIPHEDSTYQIGVFERILSKEHYFRPSAKSSTGPLASVVEWDDAMAWLDEVVRAEKEGRPMPLFKKKPRPSAVRASTEPTTPTVERPNLERAGRTVVAGPGPSPPPVVVVQKKLSLSQFNFLSRARGKSADSAERNGVTPERD